MKHLEAGIIVGGVWLVVIAAYALLYTLLSWLVGSTIAVAILATTMVVIVGATLVDWYTERRKS